MDNCIVGDIEFPDQWTVFAPVRADAPPVEVTDGIPDTLTVAGQTIAATPVKAIRCQADLSMLLGEPPLGHGKAAYIHVPLSASSECEATLGLGGDFRLQAWLNGRPLFDGHEIDGGAFPPAITNIMIKAQLRAGLNVLAVRFVSGKGSSVLALGGPRDLRNGDFRSILEAPAGYDPRWRQPELRATADDRPPVDIGARLELFVDDFLVDSLTGGARRKLQHPQPREVVMVFDRPWEGNYSGTFFPCAIINEADGMRLYYKCANYEGAEDPSEISDRSRRTRPEVTCVLESPDGLHFTRPVLGQYAFKGDKSNNIIHPVARQYFCPFKDDNPDAPPDQRYKAIAGHPQGGLSACVSADGLHWRMLVEQPIITKGAFDSQNLAFWDSLRRCYVEYHRGQPPDTGVRGIMSCTSVDFVHWTEPEPIVYTDLRREHMYTNVIRPYFRAPHLYLGFPARLVPRRTKIAGHSDSGVSDSILMSSRDGRTFQRWEQGFVRPGPEPEVWTDRNNYLAWGMVQTAPEEISLYWCEHNGHPGVRLRRGVIRTDGFASLHSAAGVGEMLTRPLVFSGCRLEVNYATSAAGTLQFELCDVTGRALPGFALDDSEVLYGNELTHTVTWRGRHTDLSRWAGRPVRLRVRLQDADLYSIRFA